MEPEAVIVAWMEALSGADVSATVGFCVHGETTRHFAIDFGARSCAMDDADAFERADVRVYGFEEAFVDLIERPHLIAGHLSAGELEIEGQRAVFARLAQQLERPRNAISARFAAAAP